LYHTYAILSIAKIDFVSLVAKLTNRRVIGN
jgi:hypothetical protein